ncbi:AAA family ATPase [Agromyces sp. NPDC056523]|uniref:AAA family ATPase n=1 Tax=Agromyces sp. NPDC056523 TaxID=3345850 RepID=UPI00366DB494
MSGATGSGPSTERGTAERAGVLEAHDRVAGFPSWLVYVDSVLPAASVFVVHGNIRDLHLVPGPNGAPVLTRTPYAIRETLARSGLPTVLYSSPLHGVTALAGSDPQAVERVLGSQASTPDASPADQDGARLAFTAVAEIAQRISGSKADPCALIIDYLSQAADTDAAGDPRALFLALLRAANEGEPIRRPGGPRPLLRNPVFLLVDRPADLPAWLLSGDGIRQAPVPPPSFTERARAVGSLRHVIFADEPATIDDAAEQEVIASRLVEATHGLSLRALTEIVRLRQDAGIPAERIEDAARRYRSGIIEDPWRDSGLHRRISNGQSALQGRVKGQPRAIRHALDILVRSASGMTAAHRRDRGSGPRGVMFFAGPTGVGKTELAKAVAELLFGDESAYVRFDMSEFADAATDARLIGSPPGYVNHDAGGELTNAVRERPFSVLLFDEIEKAHPRILDKFLQILSDGRLTDGSGDTVFFNEALIVFTSNLGIGLEGTRAEDSEADGAQFERNVQASIHDAFTTGLNRPELLGRIGDNIVVFDYLTDPIAREIAEGYVDNVLERARREQRISLELPDAVRRSVIDRAVAGSSLGARGIGSNLETGFVNPIARAVFGLPPGATRTVASVTEDERGIVTATLV